MVFLVNWKKRRRKPRNKVFLKLLETRRGENIRADKSKLTLVKSRRLFYDNIILY